VLPKSVQQLIESLSALPGVGVRTAERYALSILKKNATEAQAIASNINNLHRGVKKCPKTFMLIDADQELSPIYLDERRDKHIIMVVEDALDVVALEKTRHFKGTYHVLGGALSPIDGVGPEQLTISELLTRAEEDKAEEIIIATNASVEGESTALYLQKQFADNNDIKITRIARGLPAGVDLEYADQLTLSRAITERTAL